MNTSESFAQIAAALAAAQGEFPTIPRDRLVRVNMKSGGSYTFRYAPLETILEKTRPALAKNGLAITQSIVTDERGNEMLRTMLLHSSGEWMHCDVPIFTGSGDNQSQAYASGMTYSRRYGATLILCVSADEDDDGNGGEQGEPRPDYHRSQDNGRHGSDKGPKLPQRRQYQQQSPAQRARSGPEKGGRIVDMRDQDGGQAAPQREQHQARNDAEGDAASGEALPWMGDDLSGGQRTLLLAKAKIAGMSDADMADRFGQVTSANVNETFAALRNIADERQG